MRKWNINVIIHVMIWSGFLMLLLLFIPFYDIHFLQHPVLFVGMFFFLIGYYYLNSHVLVPVFLARKKFLGFVVITLSILSVYLYLSSLSGWLRLPEERDFETSPMFWGGPPPSPKGRRPVSDLPADGLPDVRRRPNGVPEGSILSFV